MNRFDPLVRKSTYERLADLFNDLAFNASSEWLLHRVVEAAAELTDAELAKVLLHDEGADTLRYVADSTCADTLLDILVPIEHSIAGASFTSGQPIVVHDVSADIRHCNSVEEKLNIKARSLVAVPLQYLQRCAGVLEVINRRDGAPFDDDDVAALRLLAAQATVAIDNARLIEVLEQQRAQLEARVDEHASAIKHLTTQLQGEVARRRQVEDELHRLASAVEHSASAIVITDTTPRIQYVNPAFTRVTGYTLDEVRGRNPRLL